MRLLGNVGSVASPLLLLALAACTAQGSTTTVQGPGGTSGSPAFPDLGSGTTDGGTTSTGVTDYEALFGPPASTDTTPNTLTGLWAGTAGFTSTDTRMQFTSTSIVIAEKCGTQTVGLTAAAHVTASSIKTLESKSASPSSTTGSSGATKNGSGCSLKVTPLEVARCTSSTDSDAQYESQSLTGGCFFLSGTKLSFYDSTALAGPAKLTKLSD
jgi:hypothetical protein